MARLYTVAAALATAATPEAVAEAVLNEGVAALGAAGGGLLLATNADQLTLPGAVGYDETVLAGLRTESRDAELPAAAALRSGEPVWLESRAERDERFPRLAGLEATTVALCAVPLEVQGRRLGALRFSFDQARLFDEDERRFVLALAAQTAQALDRAQLQRDRIDVSRRLQRSLLPPSVPVIPGLDVAAVYHPFGDGMEVGGDFYDIWPVRPGQWAVAIGDAAGTGPEAAGLTALVRHTLRALAMSQPEPPKVMATLNTALLEALSDLDGERFCTAIFGLITVGDAIEVWAAGGGHPPLIVQRADGRIRGASRRRVAARCLLRRRGRKHPRPAGRRATRWCFSPTACSKPTGTATSSTSVASNGCSPPKPATPRPSRSPWRARSCAIPAVHSPTTWPSSSSGSRGTTSGRRPPAGHRRDGSQAS